MKLVDADLIADCLRDEIAENEDDKSVAGMLAKRVLKRLIGLFEDLPAAQPVAKDINVPSTDCISRQAAIDALDDIESEVADGFGFQYEKWRKHFADLPSVQPERTCVNCGRTVNNGGWYADGGTRCPIEEHYALPKDGFCYLWEKRNVTDDDYPKRSDFEGTDECMKEEQE